MRAYFFHLKLELYPAPVPAHATRSPVPHSLDTKGFDRQPTTFQPARGSNVFSSTLPAHRRSRWSSYAFVDKKSDTSDTASTTGSDGPTAEEKTRSPRLLALDPDSHCSGPSSGCGCGLSHSHGNALLLPERSLNLRDAPASSVPIPGRSSNQAAARDWRYDAVAIESIDMELSGGSGHDVNRMGGGRENGAARRGDQGERPKSGTPGKNVTGGLHTKAVYLPSDPKTTDLGWGVVHLYRDAEESAMLDEDASVRKTLEKRTNKTTEGKAQNQDQPFDSEDCTTLCILAVPSWMMPADLLGFVGDQTRDDVSHFRLIRTSRANKYMVLMKFRSAKKAREWQKAWNGRLFNAMEPENCHVVFIRSVEFLTPDSDTGDASSFPHNTNDPFTPSGKHPNHPKHSKSFTSKPLAPPTPNLLELPTCPVCLERMDETTGLLTILCQHVFHCACLEKWRGSGCPVCRYTQSPSFTFPYPRPLHDHDNHQHTDPDTDPMCAVCASTNNLWVCLICGALGCGRYDSAHAYAHYEATSHCYAMDIATQHVWDYAGDGYVHRLIQNKADSKLIDLPSSDRHPNAAFRAEAADSVPREKMENMANEYTYLLTSQLDGQRRYFEEQVERAVDKASKATLSTETLTARFEAAVARFESADAASADLRSTTTRLEKALDKTSRRADKFEQVARDMSSQLREEKTMTQGLLTRVKAAEEVAKQAKAEVERVESEKRDLEEMCADLQGFISGAEKVKQLQAMGEEVDEGSVGLVEGRRKGKGRKK